MEIPLFPLFTVLFPGGVLPLRIFEPRYVDMVSDCLKRDAGFGVCLITEGGETGDAASCHDVGTLARITDWDKGPDGLLQISCMGGQRFRRLSSRVVSSQLTIARVELLPEPEPVSVPESYRSLVRLLETALERLGHGDEGVDANFDDAHWVGCRLAQLLPLELEQKQRLLEMDDALERLAGIGGALEKLA